MSVNSQGLISLFTCDIMDPIYSLQCENVKELAILASIGDY